jgi:fibronectin-binding autotransporter adhesin
VIGPNVVFCAQPGADIMQKSRNSRDFPNGRVTSTTVGGVARARLAASTALVAPAAAFQAERFGSRVLAASVILAGLVALNMPLEARAQTFGGDGGTRSTGVGAGRGGGLDQPGGNATAGSGAGGGGGGPTSAGAGQPGGAGAGIGGAGGINGFDSGSGAFGSGTNYSGGIGGNGAAVYGSGGAGGGGAGGFGAVLSGTGTFGTTANITGGAGGAGGSVFAPGYGYGYGSVAGRGGAGGGGGIGVYATGASTVTNAGTVTGGAGGTGGDSLGGLNGGNGGAGGAGYFSNTAGATLGNSGTIAGGAGAAGGASDSGASGTAGAGGVGAVLQAGGTLTNATSGVIIGGQGGPGAGGGAGVVLNQGTLTTGGYISGGDSGYDSSLGGGPGGVGVTGSNLAIVTSGTIAGGQAGSASPGGGPFANAVVFTGGVNSLTLQAGYAFDGNVVAFSAADTLALGGTTNSTFAVTAIDDGSLTQQYQNFGKFAKVGTSTWTLTGTTNVVTPWTILGGTLSISADGALGATAGKLTLNGGTLQTTATFASDRNVDFGTAGGTILTNGGTSLTLNGVVASPDGNTNLIKDGAGNLVLAGANTYSGTTSVQAGTLTLANASAAGTSAIGLAANTTLAFAGADFTIANNVALPASGSRATIDSGAGSFGISGIVSGDGTLDKTGNGNLTLSGINTYTGGTNVQAGTLALTNANAAGTGGIGLGGGTTLAFAGADFTIANNVTLPVSGSNATIDSGAGSFGISGIVSGDGSLAKIGAGTLTLSGNNTYAGGTNVQAGTLALTNANAAGTGGIGLGAGTTLAFSGADFTIANNVTLPASGSSATIDSSFGSFGISGIVSGDGTLDKTGNGNLTLSGINTYTGGTNVQDGALTVTNANSAGTGLITLFGNTAVAFSGSGYALANNVALAGAATIDSGPGAVGLAGIVSGPGELIKFGSGTLTLSGVNTYSGGTSIFEGTLGLTNASAAGTGNITMFGETALAFSGTGYSLPNNIVFSAREEDPTIDSGAGTINLAGNITGAGDLTKIGTGTLILSGNNSFAGDTIISRGTLEVDGSLNTAFTTYVSGGTTLSGIGSIGSIETGGSGPGPAIIAPGNAANPYGTLRATGTVAMDSNTIFAVSYSSTAASSLNVTGTANIGGAALQVTPNGSPTVGSKFPILVASNGITGTFSTVTFTQPVSGVTPFLYYNPNGEEIDLQFGTAGPPDLDVISVGNSINTLAGNRFGLLVTNRVLASILGGFNEQINCNNCVTGFGAIGSFSAGFHGRKQITNDLWIIGGAAFAQYKSGGARVTSAPIVAASLRYDMTELGPSRPYGELGGVVAPAQRANFGRSYGTSFGNSAGSGSASTTSVWSFGRLGWVWRLTARDEVSAAAELSRGWQTVGSYSENALPSNPYPLANSGGTDRMNIAKFGGQWTHLFGANVETQINLGVARSFGNRSGLTPYTAWGYVPPRVGEFTWAEYGLRVGYRLERNIIIDAFTDGTLGGRPIGNTIHGGLAARYTF